MEPRAGGPVGNPPGPDWGGPPPPPPQRSTLGFIAYGLFWPALFFTVLPALIFAGGLLADLFGASSRTVDSWFYMAAFMLILAMVAAPAALVLGIVVLATRPRPPG